MHVLSSAFNIIIIWLLYFLWLKLFKNVWISSAPLNFTDLIYLFRKFIIVHAHWFLFCSRFPSYLLFYDGICQFIYQQKYGSICYESLYLMLDWMESINSVFIKNPNLLIKMFANIFMYTMHEKKRAKGIIKSTHVCH